MEDNTKTTKAKLYRVKPQYIDRGQTPVTLADGVLVSLGASDVHADIEGTERKAPHKRVAKQATQAQLKILFDEGHEMIEQYEP